MNDDIFESVSQGSNGAYDEENRRIQEVSNELQRLCRLHEKEPREGKSYGGRFEIEQRVAEQYAKSNGLWIPMDNVFDLGIPGPSGNENDTYVAKDTMIDTYMSALGFEKEGKTGAFSNGEYNVWDLVPRNVLVDNEGDVFIIDAEIAKKP